LRTPDGTFAQGISLSPSESLFAFTIGLIEYDLEVADLIYQIATQNRIGTYLQR
jgi:hypothetical protein